MKWLILGILFPLNTSAQSSKKHQELIKQIGALKVYIDYAEKGYVIAKKGLHSIHRIQTGDHDLHKIHMVSLQQVKHGIQEYRRIPEIIRYHQRIHDLTRQCLSEARSTRQLTDKELTYCQQLFLQVEKVSQAHLNNLNLLTQDGTFQMTDDERLKQIDQIFANMKDHYAFCQRFSRDIGLLTAHRVREQFEVNLSKKLQP